MLWHKENTGWVAEKLAQKETGWHGFQGHSTCSNLPPGKAPSPTYPASNCLEGVDWLGAVFHHKTFIHVSLGAGNLTDKNVTCLNDVGSRRAC